jgi:hypothetical protein
MREKNEIARQVFQSGIKTAIASIPVIGEALNEFVFEARGRIKQDRINKFVEALASYLAGLKEVELDIDQIEREDFGDFFEALLLEVSITHSENKREAFKNLLLRQITQPKEIDYALLLMNVISELHEREIPILEKFYNLRADCSEHTAWHQKLTSRQDDLTRLQKYIEDDESGAYGEDVLAVGDGPGNQEQELQRRSAAVSEALGEIKKYDSPFRPETHSLLREDFYMLFQDLCNKGLLVDYSAKYRNDPYTLVEISAMGTRLMESLKD